MATATRTRRTRTAAQPEVQNVTSRGGVVHAAHPVVENAFPACRSGQQTRRATRYNYTTNAITCAKCITPPAPTRSQRNGMRQDKANEQARVIIAEETAKVVAKRDEPARNPQCSDEDFALAQQVRTLRAAGMAWWAIAHAMSLPGSGPSVKQGKTGAAHARRLWEKAWGPTYKDTSVPRETKGRVAERALTEPGKPYFSADTTDVEVIDAVQGHEITWVCRVGAGDGVVTSVQKAVVKPGSARVVLAPKGRVINFFEMVKDEGSAKLGSGPQRSVYIDRIEKVSL